jgi:hypothetical protein
MGNLPGSTPPAAPPAAPDAGQAKSSGVTKFHLKCVAHGPLGDYENESDALQAGADHLHTQHSSAVASRSETAEVEVTQSKHFRVADLEGYAKPK